MRSLRQLRDRKLGQWALAYLAGSWVLIQVLSEVGSRWNLPDVIFQGLFILLGIGFFVTLVLAWYHGEKGRQRVSGPELLMVGSLLVIAGVAVAALRGEKDPLQSVVPEPADSDADTRPSIAVLVCENLSPNPEDEYFARGIHEEVLLTLAKVHSMRSIGRESVEWYRDNPQPLRDVVQDLGVGYIANCSVRKDDQRNQVRVTFQLVDGISGTQLWAENYDEDLSARGLFDIHRNVAFRVARALEAELTAGEREAISHRPTDNLAAYEEYLRGRFLLNSRTAAGITRAVTHFERAIDIDSLFAPAYAGIADAHILKPWFAEGDYERDWPLAESFARNAVALDRRAAEGHASLGYILMLYRRDTLESESEFQEALQLSPNNPVAHQWYSNLLTSLGRHDEAVQEAERAVNLDPLSALMHSELGNAFRHARRFPQAINALQRAVQLDRDFAPAWHWMGWSYVHLGRFEEACSAFAEYGRASKGNSETYRALCHAAHQHYLTGQPVEPAPEVATTPDYFRWLAATGNFDRALEHLSRRPGWIGAMSDPMLDPLHDLPSFETLRETSGVR